MLALTRHTLYMAFLATLTSINLLTARGAAVSKTNNLFPRDTSICTPSFDNPYQPAGGIEQTINKYARFVSVSSSNWSSSDTPSSSSFYIDVEDCTSPDGANARTWIEYQERTMRIWALGDLKHCSTFRVISGGGDDVWNSPEPGAFSIQTYHTYDRLHNGKSKAMGSNVGWDSSVTQGTIMNNLLGYNKLDSQLWQINCTSCNQDPDAAKGWLARNCTINQYSSKSNTTHNCLSDGGNSSLTLKGCSNSRPTTQLWDIVLVDTSNSTNLYPLGGDVEDILD